jgi:predicted transcriptional regulator
MTKTTLRVPDDLYARISALAEMDRRSLNQELIWLLEQAVRAAEKESPPR